MATFSKESLDKLVTCHPDIQKVMKEAIKYYDFRIDYGYRSPEEQLELFKKGRKYYNGKWIKIGKTVTDKDGTYKKSKHNYSPSLAVDIIPYPFKGWSDLDQFHAVHEVVMREAKKLGINLVWGADWDGDGDIKEHTLQDYPHYELKG